MKDFNSLLKLISEHKLSAIFTYVSLYFKNGEQSSNPIFNPTIIYCIISIFICYIIAQLRIYFSKAPYNFHLLKNKHFHFVQIFTTTGKTALKITSEVISLSFALFSFIFYITPDCGHHIKTDIFLGTLSILCFLIIVFRKDFIKYIFISTRTELNKYRN